MTIAPSKVLAFIFPSRQSTAIDKLRPQTTDWAVQAAALEEPAPTLSGIAYPLLLLAIFASSLATIEFARHSNLIATIWPSNAIILAVLLRYAHGPILYSLLLAGGTAANSLAGLVAGNAPFFCITLFAANIVEIATALALLKLFRVDAANLNFLRNLLIFIAIAGVAAIGSTIIATIGFHTTHEIFGSAVMRNWYSGHALGMIIAAPFLISITSKERHVWRVGERAPEAAAIFAIFIVISICVVYFRPFVFLLAPAILLATLRFGILGATTSTFLVAIVASMFAVLGVGNPMIANADISTRIFTLQMFLAITSFWSLPAAALLTERDRLLADLSRANAQLAADSESKSHLVTGLAPASVDGRGKRAAAPVARAARSSRTKPDRRHSRTQRDRCIDLRRGPRTPASRAQENGGDGQDAAPDRMGIAAALDRRTRLAQGAGELHRRMERAMRHRGRFPLRRSEPR